MKDYNKVNMKDYLSKVKECKILKLHLTWSKAGVTTIKTISGVTLARAGGYGYEKSGPCFKELFKKLGCEVQNICETKFKLFNLTLEEGNQFLINNQINNKINYISEINDKIFFIELAKLKI